MAGGTINKAHAHGGGAVLYIVSGTGYTLMWPREAGIRPYKQGNENKVIRAPWQEGAVVSPGTGWFHQHFGTGSVDQKPVRQLALRPSGGQNPVGFRRTVSEKGLRLVLKGGSLVDFDLEDPRVRRDFEAELATGGCLIACRESRTVVDILSSLNELARGSSPFKSFKRFKPFKTFEAERSG